MSNKRQYDKHDKTDESQHSFENKRTKRCELSKEQKKLDDFYFESYENIDIHADMIGDRIRTSSYRLAILRNFKSIRGKTVMDIGAGTGILSLFCVQAGAKKVYAIEASEMAKQAEAVAKANGMENRIEVIQSKVEDLDLDIKVDVIVSEWMGYFLLYETMLPSVLYARDKWLKEGGLMFPSHAELFVAPYNDSEYYDYSLSFWDEVEDMYHVKLSCLKPLAQRCISNRVHVREVDPKDLMSHAQSIMVLDLNNVTLKDVQTTKPFNLTTFGDADIHGLVVWFDVTFPEEVLLSTSPFQTLTHWAQSILYFDKPVPVKQDSSIEGTIDVKPNGRLSRYLDIFLKYKVDNRDYIHKNYLMNDKLG